MFETLPVAGREPLWAWGTVVDDEYGFADLNFTKADGFSRVDMPDPLPRLSRFLFAIAGSFGAEGEESS